MLTICYTRILKMHSRARETSYRVVTTNYMSSLRAFHDLSERMSSMDRFLKFLLNNLKQVSGALCDQMLEICSSYDNTFSD